MPTLDKALAIFLPLVASKKTHAHYGHVVELSKKYYRPLITAKDAEHLIQRFNLREDEEQYKQRLRLTQLITPAIANTLMAPARKVPKVRPVVNSVHWKSEDGESMQKESEKREQELHRAAANFYAGKGVDHYFGSVLLDQGAVDPNAFCLVLFDSFNAQVEKPKPYPSIISSEDAWNFQYLNGNLQWLMVHRPYEFDVEQKAVKRGGRTVEPVQEAKKVKRKGHAWWMYTETHHVMLLQVDPRTKAVSTTGVVFEGAGTKVDGTGSVALGTKGRYYYRVSESELYEVTFYEHKSGAVQAFRLGFIPDHRTKGETMVNLWHAALPYMLKGVKAGSELDLSAALHAFLQKISYENPCAGHTDAGGIHTECRNGRTPDGKEQCKACNGTGLQVHRSGQDHITLRMPDTKEEAFDLTSVTHYVDLPVEVLEWQDKYVDKLEAKCYQAVYNSDRLRPADATTTTATGDIIDLQAIYDTLKPVADWYSQSRVLVYRLLASYVVGSHSLATLDVVHEFPRNMRFETTSERVKLLKEMREAGASNGAMAQVDDSIEEDLYVDDPEALQRAKTIGFFNPFRGKKEDTVLALISQDLCTKEAKVLWTNENLIYNEAEARSTEKGLDFYKMTRKLQREVIDAIVQEIITDLDDEGAEAMERAKLGMENDDTAEGGQGGNGLPPSPGDSATK